jgi:putative tricarboxylic transport membrane protein
VTSVSPSTDRPVGRGTPRPTGRTVFFALLLVVMAVYTQMAFDLEWNTVAGRIGPGFFPRIIGILSLAILVWALVTSLRPGAVVDEDEVIGADDDAGAGDLGRHPVPLLLFLAAGVVFLLVFFVPLGAIVGCALFLLAALFLLNRKQPVVNVVVALVLPFLVYLLFQTVLNSGLPAGILPRF